MLPLCFWMSRCCCFCRCLVFGRIVYFYSDCKLDTSPCKVISTAEVSISAGERALRSCSKSAVVLPCTASDWRCGCEAQLALSCGWGWQLHSMLSSGRKGQLHGLARFAMCAVQAEPPDSLVSSTPSCCCPPLAGEVHLRFGSPEPFQSLALLSNWSSKRKSRYSDFWKSKPVSWVLVAVLRRSVFTTMLKNACPFQHQVWCWTR